MCSKPLTVDLMELLQFSKVCRIKRLLALVLHLMAGCSGVGRDIKNGYALQNLLTLITCLLFS